MMIALCKATAILNRVLDLAAPTSSGIIMISKKKNAKNLSGAVVVE